CSVTATSPFDASPKSAQLPAGVGAAPEGGAARVEPLASALSAVDLAGAVDPLSLTTGRSAALHAGSATASKSQALLDIDIAAHSILSLVLRRQIACRARPRWAP